MGPDRSARPRIRTYRGTLASVPEARRFVGELLAGCPARDMLMICVTELCANAVEHTDSGCGGSFTVEVGCPRAGVARVAVTDDGGASVPAAGSAGALAEGGRGLSMVAACTSRWGYADAYPGRTVWAEATWPVAVPPCAPQPAGPQLAGPQLAGPQLAGPRRTMPPKPAARRRRRTRPPRPPWLGGPAA
jgi:anti-sigma regulatory factor (Ser/Thr protein kinase)